VPARSAAAKARSTSLVIGQTSGSSELAFGSRQCLGEQPRRGRFWLRLSPDHRRWRDRRRRRWFIRVRFQPHTGSLGGHKGFGVTRECPAPRPSVVGVGDNATVGINANLALDPVVSDLHNSADRSLGRLRRIQPLRVGYGLDKSERVVGIRIAATRDLLSEIALYRRQAVVVPLLSFGISGGARVARGGICGVTGGTGLGAEARLAQLCVGVGYRIGGQLIGATIGVVADPLGYSGLYFSPSAALRLV